MASSTVPAGTPASACAPSAFFSQRADLLNANPAPAASVTAPNQYSLIQSAIAREYNRLGGLLAQMAALLRTPLNLMLALWFLESSGTPLVPGRAALRFEVHHFWRDWGVTHGASFDSHFRFGGHNGLPGHPWEQHGFRRDGEAEFSLVHLDQANEYAALELASQLAGAEAPRRCISLGGCQLLGCNFAELGYASAVAMYDAFQQGEVAQVLGFFDFCLRQPAPHRGDLLAYLERGDFTSFAHYYNGGGEQVAYALRLKTAAADAEVILEGEAKS